MYRLQRAPSSGDSMDINKLVSLIRISSSRFRKWLWLEMVLKIQNGMPGVGRGCPKCSCRASYHGTAE